MSNWPDGWTDMNRRGGEAKATRIIPGQVLRQAAYPPQADVVPPPNIPPLGTASNYSDIPPQLDNYPGIPLQSNNYASTSPQLDNYSGIPPQLDNYASIPPELGNYGGVPPHFNNHAGIPPQFDYLDYDPYDRPPEARRSRSRRIMRAVVLLVSVLLVTSIGTYAWAEFTLKRDIDLNRIADGPPRGQGTNYLIVGSDSREGLSDQAKKDLHTGSAEGRRTDSMMLLHTGANGTTMMSLPRDSWVTIPPYLRPETGKHYRASKNKLNAAFSFGGPKLLIRTIERNTGLHIDHYAEIGFAGFVGIVDAVGGVEMCLDRDVKDKKSGVDLKKGCHNLNGSQALAFVRQRHQEAQGDLGRSKNQQKFLAALAHKAATPGVMLDPSKVYPTMGAGLDTLIVDKNMDLRTLASLFQAMKGITAGDGKRINVPVANRNFRTSKGDAVTWNMPQAKKLFAELRNDQPVHFKEKN